MKSYATSAARHERALGHALRLSILLGSTCLPNLAAAAESPPAAVDEVIVTAQRRSESVQLVPASITAVNQAIMAQRGITDVATLQFAVPSLTLGRSLGVTQIAIRGVGRSVGQPGVAINIDGVYQPRNTPMVVGQSDLDRIEVLRGPQGTLYGRNANGGAVNFITQAPTGETEGYVQASYATYDEYRLQSALNLPINDRVRTRLAVDYNKRDSGFVKNVAGGPDLDTVDTLAGRLRVAVDLTDNLDLDVNFNAFHGGGAGDYYVLTSLPSAAGVTLNPFISKAIVPLRYNRTSAKGPTSSDRDFESLSATLNWKLEGFDLKSITAYQRMDNKWDMDRDGVDLAVVDAHADESSSTFSQEFDASGATGPVDWVGGLYYMDDKHAQTTYYAFALGFAPLPSNSFLVQSMPQYQTEAYAGFGDMTWHVNDRLRLIGGVRYSNDKTTVVHRNYIGSMVTGATLLDTCKTQRDVLESDSVTYRLGGQFDLSDNKHVYATTSTGFKSGGVNFSGCNNTFAPENITSYEGGFKGRFLENRLTLNASAFWYDYSDFQLSQVVGISGRITNAASATVKGVEVESFWTPDEHWSLNGSVAFLDATFGSFVNTDSLNAALGPQNLKGKYLANSPKVSGNVGLSYRTSLTETGRFTARADVTARSKVYFREFNRPEESQTGYAVVNANLIWDSPSENYRVRLFANNLFDKGYYTSMLAVDGFGARAGSFGTPRQVGVELRAAF
jgi:iron complex outermembrane receptor protein